MTPQRRAVLESVACWSGHPTAAEVFSRVRRLLPGIAYATVYNALHALVRHGKLRQLTFGDSASRFDARTDRHDHAICLECAALIDVDPVPLSAAARRAAEASGFMLRDQHTQFFGLCSTCRAAHHSHS